MARELVNKINTMRRDAGMAVTDRISLVLQVTPRVRESFELHRNYIQGETLVTDVVFGPVRGGSGRFKWGIGSDCDPALESCVFFSGPVRSELLEKHHAIVQIRKN